MSETGGLHFFGLEQYNQFLNLRHCGYDICGPGQFSGPRVSNCFLIHCISKGSGIYTARKKTYHLNAGDAFLIIPGDIIYYAADEQDPWQFSFFAFDGKAADEVLKKTKFQDDVLAIHCDGTESLISLVNTTLTKLQQTPTNYEFYATSQLLKMLDFFSLKSAVTIITNESIRHSLVKNVVSFIDLHYTDNITVDSISAVFSVNRSYLCRIFKEETRLSPKEYITRCRMETARKLLLESELPISEIAIVCGYNSFSSFFKTFQAFYNSSPKSYRKKLCSDSHQF